MKGLTFLQDVVVGKQYKYMYIDNFYKNYKSARPIVTNLGTLQIIQDCSNDGPYLSQRWYVHVLGKQYEYIDNFYINPQSHFNQTSWVYEFRKIPMKVKPFFKVYSSTFNPEHKFVLSKVIWFIATKVGATHS